MAIDEKAFESAREAWLKSASDYTRLDDCIKAAIIAYESAKQKEAEGWVLVPREPTEAMVAASLPAFTNIRDIWAAMLAAAPEPPEAA